MDFFNPCATLLCVKANQNHANTLLNGYLAYSFASMLHILFDEPSGPIAVTSTLSLVGIPYSTTSAQDPLHGHIWWATLKTYVSYLLYFYACLQKLHFQKSCFQIILILQFFFLVFK